MTFRFTRDPNHDQIFEDQEFKDLIEAVVADKNTMQFVGAVIQRFKTADEVVRGRLGSGENVEAYANRIFRAKKDRDRAQPVVRLIESLYQRCTPEDLRCEEGQLRGTLLEALVERQLVIRYGEGLYNNVFIERSNGGEYRTSTSVDVAGYDGQVGECHDCKARAKNVDAGFVRELIGNLRPHGFQIGVATTDSFTVAQRELQHSGIPTAQIRIVGPESWWGALPLQAL